MVRKALGTFCAAVSLMKTRHDVPPLPQPLPESEWQWALASPHRLPVLLAINLHFLLIIQ